MKKLRVALCDECKEYAKAFQEYVMSEGCDVMEFEIYTSIEAYEQAENNKDIWLMTWQFYKERSQDEFVVLLCDQQIPIDIDEKRIIDKYQKAREIIKQLLYFWQEADQSKELWKSVGGAKELRIVYSPDGNDIQPFYTSILSRYLAKDKKVLYISLLEYGQLDEEWSEEGLRDISDLINMMENNQANLEIQLECVVEKDGNLARIPSAYNPANINEISKEQYSRLFNAILEETDYDILLLDMGNMMNGFFEYVERCSKLYCLSGTSSINRSKTEKFLKLIETYNEAFVDKVVKVDIKEIEFGNISNKDMLDRLEYSEFGDMVRAG